MTKNNELAFQAYVEEFGEMDVRQATIKYNALTQSIKEDRAPDAVFALKNLTLRSRLGHYRSLLIELSGSLDPLDQLPRTIFSS